MKWIQSILQPKPQLVNTKELVLFFGTNRDMNYVLVSLAKTDATVAELAERQVK